MRSAAGRPAPRSLRAKGQGARSLAPVAAAILPAAARPLPYRALPAINKQVGRSERSMAAARSTDSVAGSGTLGNDCTLTMAPLSLHAASAGTIKVAICPGVVEAAMIASAASCPIVDAELDDLIHEEKGRAIPSISEVNGVSWRRW